MSFECEYIASVRKSLGKTCEGGPLAMFAFVAYAFVAIRTRMSPAL